MTIWAKCRSLTIYTHFEQQWLIWLPFFLLLTETLMSLKENVFYTTRHLVETRINRRNTVNVNDNDKCAGLLQSEWVHCGLLLRMSVLRPGYHFILLLCAALYRAVVPLCEPLPLWVGLYLGFLQFIQHPLKSLDTVSVMNMKKKSRCHYTYSVPIQLLAAELCSLSH